MDGVVSAHGQPKAVTALFVSHCKTCIAYADCSQDNYIGSGIAEVIAETNAHSGFLNSALSLKRAIFESISDLVRENCIKHVLFTGHSAGGATASLLSLTYLLTGEETCKFEQFIEILPYSHSPVNSLLLHHIWKSSSVMSRATCEPFGKTVHRRSTQPHQ
jgi:putative lipase involved disintegration of autophagic bodies